MKQETLDAAANVARRLLCQAQRIEENLLDDFRDLQYELNTAADAGTDALETTLLRAERLEAVLSDPATFADARRAAIDAKRIARELIKQKKAGQQ